MWHGLLPTWWEGLVPVCLTEYARAQHGFRDVICWDETTLRSWLTVIILDPLAQRSVVCQDQWDKIT